MVTIRKIIIAMALLSLFLSFPVNSQTIDAEQLLRTADLMRLIHTDSVVNLQAQMTDPNATTAKISDLNDFIAIGVVAPTFYTALAQFDIHQTIVHQNRVEMPWMGVTKYKQGDMPGLSLQDGFAAVRSCMAQQKDPTPDEISGVIIYKTISDPEFIYDYLFRDPALPKGKCREYLYATQTGQCHRGMVISCHFDIQHVKK